MVLKHSLCHDGSLWPLLLLMDVHSSHYTLETVTMAKENSVILFMFVPNTTQEMQPLETADAHAKGTYLDGRPFVTITFKHA